MRGLARDFGARGITVNSIQPGPIDSDMNPPNAEFMHNFMAIKRHIHADEVAELTAYIAGAYGAMRTGVMHTIDGGMRHLRHRGRLVWPYPVKMDRPIPAQAGYRS